MKHYGRPLKRLAYSFFTQSKRAAKCLRHQDQSLPERRQKRKLEQEIEEEREISVPSGDARKALLSEVGAQVTILNSTFSWKEADRAAAKRATHVLAELAKNGINYQKNLNSPNHPSLRSLTITFLRFFNFLIFTILFGAEEVVNVIVEGGAVPALVKHLQPPPSTEGDRSPKPYEHEVEKGSAFALGLLAVKVTFS
jgi:hypothetical protein